MSLSRRDFLRYGMAAASTAVASGAIDLSPVEAAATSLRIKEAKAFPGVCPYCAVGCAQLIYVKDGKIVDIEGDPDAPHTEGALCPKGSSTYQLSLNERRITRCLYRAPGATAWEEKPLAWMMAEERGAKIIHVDPRFTRTSATADIWVPIRSGTNIVFFGGLIRYAIESKKYFHDYVVAYTNASLVLDPQFKTPTDLDGLFSGFNPAIRSYDQSTWKFQLDADGYPRKDPTLHDPNCVFQRLRRQYSRYTPEMVERVCGIPKELFLKVADIYCSASGPDKTATVSYPLPLNQSTNGVQQIRALCMLQLILGNIGRPA